MKTETLQKVLPASALGISIIIHLCIFLAISGFVLIEAYNPPQTFVADTIQPSNTITDLPPEPQPEQAEPTPQTPTQDPTPQDLTPPVTVTSTNVDIIASTAPSSTPTFTVAAAPAGAVFSATPGQQQEAKPKDNNPANLTKRSMASLFGNLGASEGLVGYLYDLKQTRDQKPSEMAGIDASKFGGNWGAVMGQPEEKKANGIYHGIVSEFVSSGWSMSKLSKFYRVEQPIGLYQLCITSMQADEAPKAFRAEKTVKPRRWVIVYSGKIIWPEDGTFRFVGVCDDILAVRLNNNNVLDGSLSLVDKSFSDREKIGPTAGGYTCSLVAGKWVNMKAGQTYPIQIIIGEEPGGWFCSYVLVQKKDAKYPQRAGNKGPVLPVVQFIPTHFPPPTYQAEKTAPELAKQPFACTQPEKDQ